jgi:hypothetical protein
MGSERSRNIRALRDFHRPASRLGTGTPEPGRAWAMIILGFAGLGFAGDRRSGRAEAVIA